MVESDLYDIAVSVIIRQTRVSTVWLMRHLGSAAGGLTVGYNLCALFLARMELQGIVGRVADDNRRDVLVRMN